MSKVKEKCKSEHKWNDFDHSVWGTITMDWMPSRKPRNSLRTYLGKWMFNVRPVRPCSFFLDSQSFAASEMTLCMSWHDSRPPTRTSPPPGPAARCSALSHCRGMFPNSCREARRPRSDRHNALLSFHIQASDISMAIVAKWEKSSNLLSALSDWPVNYRRRAKKIFLY